MGQLYRLKMSLNEGRIVALCPEISKSCSARRVVGHPVLPSGEGFFIVGAPNLYGPVAQLARARRSQRRGRRFDSVPVHSPTLACGELWTVPSEALAKDGQSWSKSFLGKSLSGSCFQIPFEGHRLPLIRKADIGLHPPRTIPSRMLKLSTIVVRQPSPKIARYSDIPLVTMIFTSKNIDIFHAFYSAFISKSCLGNISVQTFLVIRIIRPPTALCVSACG